MNITNIQHYHKNKTIGTSADIIFDTGKTQTLFFEVDEQFSEYIASDASAFLAAMLPIAMHTKEAVHVDGSVSERFMNQMATIMKIVTGWNHGFHPVQIRAKTTTPDTKKGIHTGSFFSGGADSYYTYIKHQKQIDSLIFVHGFDIKLSDTDLYALVEKNIRKIAQEKHLSVVNVRTNIREIYDQFLDWDLAHGFAVGSISLWVRNGFHSIYVSCGLPSKNNSHHSMTPDLDPLWSGEHMKVIHYGCHADKLLKLKELSRVPLVMETLRVCWVNKKNAYNCCSCEKCYRNMLGLYVCGSLKKSKTFQHDINLEGLKKTTVRTYELQYFQAILDALDANGDTSDVRLAVAAVISNNTSPSLKKRILTALRSGLRTIDKKYNNNRLYWYLASKGLV